MGLIRVPTTLGGCEGSAWKACEILGTELGMFLSVGSFLAIVIFNPHCFLTSSSQQPHEVGRYHHHPDFTYWVTEARGGWVPALGQTQSLLDSQWHQQGLWGSSNLMGKCHFSRTL